LLQTTPRSFPEPTITRSGPLTLEAIFTTTLGFRDKVEFVIDAEAQCIDFRSRSLFGFCEWGKNRSRMNAFVQQFDQEAKAAQVSDLIEMEHGARVLSAGDHSGY